ncbi:MAG: type II/IV secretion system ATPase subunit [Hadesarchaea archaeon]|nr:type II/IV secretion system ATPase subunit [Hadesarchaea archaeon]MDH5685692.1 type II/IV secretion system ATPase subunit [Hadesarchaea archaeon]
MSCEPAIVKLGDERVLKFKCEGCEHGASIEESEVCMREVVRALAEYPAVSAVVLADIYEREYNGPSLAELKEVAKIFKAYKHWPFAHLAPTDCKRCESERRQQLKDALDVMPGDPARAREELEVIVRELRARSKRGAEKCRRCRATFIERALTPMLSSLKRAKLASIDRKNREGYAKILEALIHPCFMSSRFALEPPAGAELVDAYRVGSSEVRIYRLRDKLQHLYFLILPEHKIPHKQVLLLHRARQALLKQRPEFEPDPLRAREQLTHLGGDLMTKLVVDEKLDVAREDVEELAQHLARFTAGLGVLEVLLADARVQDVYIDAPVGRTPIHIYHRDFEECLTNIHLTPDDAKSLISRFRAISGRPFSEADPVLDLNLGGVRIAAIGHPLSPEGLAFALRKHKPTPWTLPQFIQARYLTPYAAGLLSLMVDAQTSLLVTGSRGSGKTSLLGALMLELLPKFRVIVLEDTSELPIEQLRVLGFKVQSLRVQSAVSGTSAELRAEDALRAALRLGESILVVGEVRGEEARVLYEAMRVGAAGNSVMGTIHGATARDVFERVVYDLGIPASSFKATDAIVVAAPIRPRGSVARMRRVVQVTEVRKGWRKDPMGEEGFEDLMKYDPTNDELEPTRALTGLKSQLIDDIARKWGTKPRDVLRNLELRAEIQGALVEAATKLKKPELLEAEFSMRSNLVLHALLEKQLRNKQVDYREIFKCWRSWLRGSAREYAGV